MPCLQRQKRTDARKKKRQAARSAAKAQAQQAATSVNPLPIPHVDSAIPKVTTVSPPEATDMPTMTTDDPPETQLIPTLADVPDSHNPEIPVVVPPSNPTTTPSITSSRTPKIQNSLNKSSISPSLLQMEEEYSTNLRTFMADFSIGMPEDLQMHLCTVLAIPGQVVELLDALRIYKPVHIANWIYSDLATFDRVECFWIGQFDRIVSLLVSLLWFACEETAVVIGFTEGFPSALIHRLGIREYRFRLSVRLSWPV